MKKLILLFLILLAGVSLAQSVKFEYNRSFNFETADSLISPYLCTVDSSGNLWVVSNNLSSTSAINGIFKLPVKDTILHLVVAFADSDSVRDVTGITSIGNDIFVSAREIAPNNVSSPYWYPYSEMFYFPNGDPMKRQVFRQPGYKDYGTWYCGLSADKDGFLYFGQSYLVTIGTIDGRKSSPKFGWTVDYARKDFSTPMEPGGSLSLPNATDLIRDIAILPQGNYLDTNTVIYSSRNSATDFYIGRTGGIAVWTGGTETAPISYHAQRVTDLTNFLTFGTSMPYGIAVDPANGYLFVCGNDSAKKWVKGFQVNGNFAAQIMELPSSTSNDVKDINGAPFISPADVAFNIDGSIAYVIDQSAKKVFKFSLAVSDVRNEPKQIVNSFNLFQNYPNPFNPNTHIIFKISSAMNIRVNVYNIYGEVIATLANRFFQAGQHILNFDGSKFASGIYICKATAGKFSKSIKMILIK
jgi:hypothetical protein